MASECFRGAFNKLKTFYAEAPAHMFPSQFQSNPFKFTAQNLIFLSNVSEVVTVKPHASTSALRLQRLLSDPVLDISRF